jgi:hypothetical protein
MTNHDTLTAGQVNALQREALAAGDTSMYEDCQAVLAEWYLATRVRSRHQDRIARILASINYAEGMAQDD